jgi:putative Holliday junction resolvase
MGRILGIDYGDVRIGLALTDPLKIIASPFRTIQNRNNDFIIKELGSIINEKKIETLVIGLPIGLNNQETIQTKKVRLFADLIKILGIPIYFQDERLSSISAKKSLIIQNIKTGSNKSMIDKAAAAIFLQQFIDTKN